MFPARFDYFRPQTLEEALGLLQEHQGEAKVLAGGMSLIPLMKLRVAKPARLIDIGRLSGLDGIEARDGELAIGALTRHAELDEARLIRQSLPLMADAAGVIGDTQVRNWGTIGGALAEADPAGDWGPVVLALNARLRCLSARGERFIAAREFFRDAYATALASDELVTQVLVPGPGPGATGAYLKLERKAGDFAIAGVAVQLAVDEQGVCREIGIGLGAVGLTPIKAMQAEAALRGQRLSEATLADAAEAAAREAEPVSDIRGSAAFKRDLVRALLRRAIEIALRRSRGEQVEAGHV